MIVRILPPPAAAPGLPHGTDRGGIFDAPWESSYYIGPGYNPLPLDASASKKVPMSRDFRPMQFTSTQPQPIGAIEEFADPPPLPIKAYRPRAFPAHGGIFAGVGQVEEMARARPEWTRWQIIDRARRARLSGMGGCGCPSV